MSPALAFGVASTALFGLFGLVVITAGRPQPKGLARYDGVVLLVALLAAITAILCAAICFAHLFNPLDVRAPRSK